MISPDNIAVMAARKTFGSPLITNVYRSIVVEAIVSTALPDWEWCSADYAPCDFRRGPIRIEVKQSALRQSWVSQKQAVPSWDIAPRTGYWPDATTWIPAPGRNADIYVLCLHTVIEDGADHRDPLQWQFFVVATNQLPPQKRISVGPLRRLTSPVDYSKLRDKVEGVVLTMNV